ncbi:MAG TPA: transposase [Ktedonobacteraceae bacterium]|nr:transposase [Ktedonobacteraceae bacterium]
MSIKAFKYRIYANKATTEKLQWVLDCCRELYNAALAERKEAWRMAGKSIDYYEQKRDLVEIKEIRPEYKDIASHVLQDVITRIKRTYDAFFRRIKNGEKPGHPRFQGRNRYTSFCYPDHAGWRLEGKHLHLTKIGTVKIKLHRQIEGKIKTLTIKREGEHWYAIFSCEVETEKLPVSYEDAGIDLGITHFAALSDGTFIDNPRHFRKSEKKLASAQQALSRKKRDSHRRKKASARVAKCHRKIRNQRKDFHHKASRKLVNQYQIIAFEDLQTKNLMKRPKPKQDENGKYLPNGASAKSGLNKSIQDAGWRTFTEMVSAKAACAGRTVIFVDPFKTSQICSQCLKEGLHKELDERVHTCVHCGVILDRDTNAAVNILRLGHKSTLGGTRPTGQPPVEVSRCT